MSASYHQGELEIARNPSHPAHILPGPIPADARILDVGCGAGQTLIAAYPEHDCIGVDVDLQALLLGRKWTQRTEFILAEAEHLPLGKQSCDLVIARVSLAYTDVRRSLEEIHRVLKPRGRVWLVLHPFSIPFAAARRGGLKGWIFFVYIFLNSLLLHLFGLTFRFRGRRETFQTAGGMSRLLRRSGFEKIVVDKGRHFVVNAVASESDANLLR